MLDHLLGLGDAISQEGTTSARAEKGMHSEFLYATYIGAGSGPGLSDIEILGEEHLDIPRLKTPTFNIDVPAGQYMGTSYFTSSGTFTKGDFAGLGFVEVELVAGGGGGGGTGTTGSGQTAVAGGGGSGAYAAKVIQVGDLATNETVTVGSGGSGGSGANDGSTGGTSSFGSHFTAAAGGGGAGSAASTGSGSQNAGGVPGEGGTGTADIRINGSYGGNGIRHISGGLKIPGWGAPSIFGGLLRPSIAASGDGSGGITYGCGGSGAQAEPNTGSTRTGGSGSDGIVLVHRYAADVSGGTPGGFTEGETLLCIRNNMIPLLIIGAITGATH